MSRPIKEIQEDIEMWKGAPFCPADVSAREQSALTKELIQALTNGIPLDRLTQMCEAEREGRCVVLPCKVGDTVYRICKCKDIPPQLDGTLNDIGGGYGTATGYYCPYIDKCPHDIGDCDKANDIPEVFHDCVTSMWIDDEDGAEWLINFSNTHGCKLSDFGKTVFLTEREAAEAKGAV